MWEVKTNKLIKPTREGEDQQKESDGDSFHFIYFLKKKNEQLEENEEFNL